jgi:hypothetical protein
VAAKPLELLSVGGKTVVIRRRGICVCVLLGFLRPRLDRGEDGARERTGSVDTCIGCNPYNSAAMRPLANTFVNMAGVGATALGTWAAILGLARRHGRRWPRAGC